MLFQANHNGLVLLNCRNFRLHPTAYEIQCPYVLFIENSLTILRNDVLKRYLSINKFIFQLNKGFWQEPLVSRQVCLLHWFPELFALL